MLAAQKLSILVSYMAISILGSSSVLATAFTGGPPSGVNGSTGSGGSDCSVCHSNSAGGAGSVQIIGAPSSYLSGVLYNLTVRVEDPVKIGAGYQFSVEDAAGIAIGTLSPVDANSQLNGGFINHTSAGVNTSLANWASLGNAAEFQFTWQAPAGDAGPLTFWAAGNAINHAGGDNGDLIYLTNQSAAFAGDVPTVSEWGLVILLISLMTAGTIVMVRQRPGAALAVNRP